MSRVLVAVLALLTFSAILSGTSSANEPGPQGQCNVARQWIDSRFRIDPVDCYAYTDPTFRSPGGYAGPDHVDVFTVPWETPHDLACRIAHEMGHRSHFSDGHYADEAAANAYADAHVWLGCPWLLAYKGYG